LQKVVTKLKEGSYHMISKARYTPGSSKVVIFKSNSLIYLLISVTGQDKWPQ